MVHHLYSCLALASLAALLLIQPMTAAAATTKENYEEAITATTTDILPPRLFPAAKQEQYDPQTHTLRTLHRFHASSFLHDSATAHEYGVGDDTPDPVIQQAKARFLDFVQNDLPNYPDEYPINPQEQELVPITSIRLVVTDKHEKPQPQRHDSSKQSNNNNTILPAVFDESYQIQIGSSSDSHIILQSKTVFGMVRALESLAQLLEFGWMDTAPNTKKPDKFPVRVIRNTPIFITDAPTYSYRGLMIDTARHYLPLDLILNNLNVMAMNKLNVLHWHMTDEQSWPFQSTTFPEVSDKGAWAPHAVYSHADVQKVIDEGYLRGIRVIPEFDLPGHSQVIGRSHPELMAACGWVLDPTLSTVYDFVEALYQEVAELFPDSFIHIGGDEVDMDCWNKDPKILGWAHDHGMTTSKELLNYFESILTDVAASCGKTPIVWQELLNEGVDLPPGTVIDVWKGFDTKTIEDATKRNYSVIISGCWYLDHLKDNWKTYYNCEPLAFNGTQAQKDLIMGGHASMWGERVDATDFMERVWPRASAVAERLWSGSLPQSYHDLLSKTVDARMTKFRCFMVLRGVSASPIGPGSCPHEEPFPPAHHYLKTS